MHFFCELHDDLVEDHSFGPMVGNLTTKFNVSSKFKLNNGSTSFKAFAAQGGKMIIQQSADTNLVNVIIKPNSSLEIDLSPVKYYVYRGLLKSSFISGSGLVPKTAPNKSEFLTRFWTEWDKYLTDNVLQDVDNSASNYAEPPSPHRIGYDSFLSTQLQDDVNIENLFSDTHPSGLISQTVLAGEWIGDFGNDDVFFEVVTDTENFYKTYDNINSKLVSNGLVLGYLRKKEFQVEIDPNLSSLSTTLAEIQKRLLREEILSYVDPCAFYGMHSTPKIGLNAYINGNMKFVKYKNVYDDVLVKSYTANKKKVYIDVRSELGYSYNFHGNYDPVAQIQYKRDIDPDTSYTTAVCSTNGWPIFSVESNLGSKRSNKLDIKLRIDDNTDPLVFVQGDILERVSNFLEVQSGATDWTESIRIEIPNDGSGSNKNNVARHVRINYFRLKNGTSSAQVFPFESTLDSVFAPVDLPFSIGGIDTFAKVSSSKYGIVQNADFSYIAKAEVYKEGMFYTFFTTIEHRHKNSGSVYPSIPNESEANGSDFSNSPVFPMEMIIEKTEVIGSPSFYYMNMGTYGSAELPSYKEDVFILSITEAELNSLRLLADSDGILQNQPRRIVFGNRTAGTGTNGAKYIKYTLQIQGIRNDNAVHTTTLSSIEVYTADEKLFNSKDFGDNKNLPINPPDTGKMSLWAYSGSKDYKYSDLEVYSVISNGVIAIKDKDQKGVEFDENSLVNGRIYFPTDSSGDTTLSTTQNNYPVMVIVHGNGHFYINYDILGHHLAKNGFIVCSINVTRVNITKLVEIDPAPQPGSIAQVAGITHHFQFRDEEETLYLSTSTNEIFTFDGTSLINKNWVLNTHFKILGTNESIQMLINGSAFSGGLGATGRSNCILPHLAVLKNIYPTQLDNNLTLFGHSRGADAVIVAGNKMTTDSNLITNLTSLGLNQLKGVISLAPTDQYPDITRDGNGDINQIDRVKMINSIPYYVIYGSRDYDIYPKFRNRNAININQMPDWTSEEKLAAEAVYMQSGFSIYDRSSGMDKLMTYVKGATHNGFITPMPANVSEVNLYKDDLIGKNYNSQVYPEANYNSTQISDLHSNFIKKEADQQSFVNAFVHAFLRKYALEELIWDPYIDSSYIPASVAIKDVDFQFERSTGNQLILGASSVKTSIPSGMVKVNDEELANSFLGEMRLVDGDDHSKLTSNAVSPHDTSGIAIDWKSNDKLTISISGANMDATSFSFLTFRISNASLNTDLEGVKLNLKDSSDVEKFISLAKIKKGDVRDGHRFAKIPATTGVYEHYNYLDANRAAMHTVKIELTSFSGLDLSELVEIGFIFPANGNGRVFIDNIMYTN